MTRRALEFFADPEDLVTLFEAWGNAVEYKYVQMQSDLNSENWQFDDLVELPATAFVSAADPVPKTNVLIVPRDEEVEFREIRMADGSGIKKVAGQNFNPDSVVLLLGGDASDRTLIMSNLGTTSATKSSREMLKQLGKVVRAMSVRVGPKGSPHLVMHGALQKLLAGWRLARGKSWQVGTDVQVSEQERADLAARYG